MANFLTSLFSGGETQKATNAPLGGGMADMARTAILRQEYKNYSQNAQMEGMEPMPFDQWVAQRG